MDPTLAQVQKQARCRQRIKIDASIRVLHGDDQTPTRSVHYPHAAHPLRIGESESLDHTIDDGTNQNDNEVI